VTTDSTADDPRDTPKVSVVVPLYNKEDHITSAIQSVLGQDFADLELIVVNDGSTDGSAEAVKPFLDRIVYEEQPNSGPGAARNRGIELARGEYIAFLDADDEWLPDKLSSQVQFMDERDDIMWCSVNAWMHTDKATEPRGTLIAWNGDESGWQIIDDWFLESAERHVTATPGVLIRKEVLEIVGMFDPDIPSGQDMDMWIRIARAYPRFALLRQPAIRIMLLLPGCVTLGGRKKYASMLAYLRKHVTAIAEDQLETSSYGTFVASRLQRLARQALVSGNRDILREALDACPDGWVTKRQQCVFRSLTLLPSSLLRLILWCRRLVSRRGA